MAKTQITQTADEGKARERVEVERLLLDPNNPRLAEYALGGKPTQQELLKILWQKMAFDENKGAGAKSSNRLLYDPNHFRQSINDYIMILYDF